MGYDRTYSREEIHQILYLSERRLRPSSPVNKAHQGHPISQHTEQPWKDVTTEEVFKGRTVVLFSLPGAYTPTCSSTHLPRYNELAGVFMDNGVDEIVCLSVNDAFVMNEWKQDQDAENITLLPDENGEFTAGMGMLVDKSNVDEA